MTTPAEANKALIQSYYDAAARSAQVKESSSRTSTRADVIAAGAAAKVAAENNIAGVTDVSRLLNQMLDQGDADGSIEAQINNYDSVIVEDALEAWYLEKNDQDIGLTEEVRLANLGDAGKLLAKSIAAGGADIGTNAVALLAGNTKLEAEIAAVQLAEAEEALKKGDVLVSGTDPEEADNLEEKVSLSTKTYQCYLSHNIERVAEFHRIQFSKDLQKKSKDFFLDNGDPRIILVDDSNPESSYFASNKMTSLGKTDGFNDIEAHEIAQLLPELRIYKITRSEGKEVSKVELEFDTATDDGFLKTPREGGFAKGTGAGVKSFNWSFVGGDPFTATRDLTATLKIYFQDFQDLTKERTGKNLYDPKQSDFKYRYLDLVLQPDCRKAKGRKKSPPTDEQAKAEGLGYDIYRPECYEVAIDVGYAYVKSSETMRSSIAKMINSQKDTLYLTAKEHTFDIGQDGTFELTIQYAARLATALGDKGMNVLVPGGGHALETKSKFIAGSRLLYNLEQVDKLISEAKGEKSENKDSAKLKKLEVLREIIVAKSNISLHSGIMNSLVSGGYVYMTSINRELFNRFSKYSQFDRGEQNLVGIDDITMAGAALPAIVAPTSAWTNTYSTIGLKGPEYHQKRRLISQPNDYHNLYFTTLGNIIAVITAHVMAVNPIVPGGQLVPDVSRDIEKWLSGIDTDKDNPLDPDELNKILGKGFMGGLIATPPTIGINRLLSGLNAERAAQMERFRIILGTVSYRSVIDEKVHAINLMHLPVSMEMFTDFMIDKVVQSKRTFYSYQDFVRDLLTDVVLKNLSRECFGGYFEERIRAGINLFKGQGVKNKEPITNHSSVSIYGPRGDPGKAAESAMAAADDGDPATISAAELEAYNSAFNSSAAYKVLKLANATQVKTVFIPGSSKSAKNYDYLMFSAFSVKGFAEGLGGCIDDDAELGIPHFRFGQKTGFLKSASFNKTPLEFMAEARYVTEGSDNMLNMLAGRYEMQMSMVGNGLFVPGQYVFFNSIAMGAGHPSDYKGEEARSTANRMGLGGYHIIIEVGNSISPGKFETTIKALWDSGGTSIECKKGKK